MNKIGPVTEYGSPRESLIQAAPELLEALKGLFAHSNRWAERGEPKPSCLQKAQAAIAKAEGKL